MLIRIMPFRYPHTVTIENLKKSSNTQVYDTSFSEKWFVQPLDMEDALLADGSFRQAYKAYAPTLSLVKEGARVTYDSKKYIVDTINKYTQGSTGHFKIIMREVK